MHVVAMVTTPEEEPEEIKPQIPFVEGYWDLTKSDIVSWLSTNVVQFLVTHDKNWTMERHHKVCWETEIKCPCCKARDHDLRSDREACKLCLDAWTLSAVSNGIFDAVRANGIMQPRWFRPWGPAERKQKKRLGTQKAGGELILSHHMAMSHNKSSKVVGAHSRK